MISLLQDLRFARRVLAASPGFTAVAVVTLALGIGANTAIFSVVDGVLLRRLPYDDPDRLVLLYQAKEATDRGSFSPADYFDVARESRSFAGLAAFAPRQFNLTGDGEPERIAGLAVSGGFFDVLGAKCRWGAGFTAGADAAHAAHAADTAADQAVLAHGLWQRRFGGDPALVGRTVRLDAGPVTVVGVLPPGFRFAPDRDAELFVRNATDLPPPPLPPDEDLRAVRGLHWFQVLGRLAPGVELSSARAEVEGIGHRLAAAPPETNAARDLVTVSLRDELVGGLRPALLTLLAAVGLVLLIACTNVANLLLARALARGRELAIRSTLGAGPFRLLRQLLAESLLLALAGGGLGLVLGYWGVEALVRLAPPDLAGLAEITLDHRVLAFTAAVALASVLVFGLVPAWLLSRPDSQAALKEGGRATAGARTGLLRSLLVVAETALALVLLVGAGLLVRSFVALQAVDPGFDPDRVLTFSVAVPPAKYAEPARVAAFYQEAYDRLRALPGVESAGGVLTLPFAGSAAALAFSIEGEPDPPPGEERDAGYQVTGGGYFRTLRIPVVAGRDLEPSDGERGEGGEGGRRVAVVNRAMARKYFPGTDPIGRRITFDDADEGGWMTVVGVVGDVRHFALDQPVRPEVYVPLAQDPWPFTTFVLRTTGDPMTLGEAARRAILEVDPDQPISRLRPMTAYLAESVAQRRFVLLLIGLFAAVAAVLAALGIYGVVAHSVTQRTHEIGIRMALGAGKRSVLADVLGRGMALAGLGVAAGAAAALAATRLLASLLYGVGAADPPTYAGVALLLAAVALVATLLPARRASRVEPMVALRHP
jgi:putative ABC transport system permease protein